MRRVRKSNVRVTAFELGLETKLEKELIDSGMIVKHQGYYEIYSKETKEDGEIAKDGDFVKVDKSKKPYPNGRDRFLSHHKHIGGYNYIQFPQEILSWTYDDDQNDVIDYLLSTGKLKINKDSFDKFYQAELWGTTLWAKKTDIVLIYDVKLGKDQIEDVDFNLIDKQEFDKTYEYI